MSALTRTVFARRALPSLSSAMAKPRFALIQSRAETTAPTTTTTTAARAPKEYPPPPRRPREPDWTKMPDRRFFGLKWFPGMMAKPLYPFFIAAIIMIYVIDRAADAMMDSEEWRDHPRNPKRRTKPSDH